jgi:8-oxo-dGTP pyrophosphatase MutT (NUDIX family)
VTAAAIAWASGPAVARHDVGALLVTDNGRYLMQLRDERPDIRVPGHWGLFGGGVEPSEADDEAALRRELLEELELRAGRLRWFTELVYVEPVPPHRACRKAYFEARVTAAQLAGLRLREGAGLRPFAADELLREPRVVPWDGFAVMLHARERLVFPADAGWAAPAAALGSPPPP